MACGSKKRCAGHRIFNLMYPYFLSVWNTNFRMQYTHMTDIRDGEIKSLKHEFQNDGHRRDGS